MITYSELNAPLGKTAPFQLEENGPFLRGKVVDTRLRGVLWWRRVEVKAELRVVTGTEPVITEAVHFWLRPRHSIFWDVVK